MCSGQWIGSDRRLPAGLAQGLPVETALVGACAEDGRDRASLPDRGADLEVGRDWQPEPRSPSRLGRAPTFPAAAKAGRFPLR
jgi:hypothetical protein